jgi:hypothetical protein
LALALYVSPCLFLHHFPSRRITFRYPCPPRRPRPCALSPKQPPAQRGRAFGLALRSATSGHQRPAGTRRSVPPCGSLALNRAKALLEGAARRGRAALWAPKTVRVDGIESARVARPLPWGVARGMGRAVPGVRNAFRARESYPCRVSPLGGRGSLRPCPPSSASTIFPLSETCAGDLGFQVARQFPRPSPLRKPQQSARTRNTRHRGTC